jgi:hypothetical protein
VRARPPAWGSGGERAIARERRLAVRPCGQAHSAGVEVEVDAEQDPEQAERQRPALTARRGEDPLCALSLGVLKQRAELGGKGAQVGPPHVKAAALQPWLSRSGLPAPSGLGRCRSLAEARLHAPRI